MRALAIPPQPEYLGYAWLGEAPCADLRGSVAGATPDPQPREYAPALRDALDATARRFGECQNGSRVAVGAPCDIGRPGPAH